MSSPLKLPPICEGESSTGFSDVPSSSNSSVAGDGSENESLTEIEQLKLPQIQAASVVEANRRSLDLQMSNTRVEFKTESLLAVGKFEKVGSADNMAFKMVRNEAKLVKILLHCHGFRQVIDLI